MKKSIKKILDLRDEIVKTLNESINERVLEDYDEKELKEELETLEKVVSLLNY